MSEALPESKRVRPRIENLSDLVFGLALSIGSIILISNLPQTPGDLVSGIVLFGFSFLIVVWIWSGYTSVMVALPFEVEGAYLLNLVLLFCVAIQPYLFYVMQRSSFGLLDFSSSIYALDVGIMMLLLAGMNSLLLKEEGRSNAKNIGAGRLARFRRAMIAEAAAGLTFLVSAVPIFWTPVPLGNFLRFDLWYVTLAVFFVVTTRIRGRR